MPIFLDIWAELHGRTKKGNLFMYYSLNIYISKHPKPEKMPAKYCNISNKSKSVTWAHMKTKQLEIQIFDNTLIIFQAGNSSKH